MATETVTVLFTDLVGSTELLSRVGEAQADELRREHFGLLRKGIEQTGGREVKNLGDGLMVVFDGVASALDAAVAMQQAITARPAESEPLSIKVGVAVGDAEVEDDDYFGLPVVEAARLCAKAQGGEILTTEFVRMLARSRSKMELESIGALELKGLDEPVETYRVRWTPLDLAELSAVPMPKRLLRSATERFVGRIREREVLDVAWKAAREGDRRAVLIGGEPGIGKTALTASFAADAAAAGAWVLYGRCDEDLRVPYQPWVEALAYLVDHAPSDRLDAHVAACGPALIPLVPALAQRTDVAQQRAIATDADSDRQVMFGAVVDLLASTSTDAPVVLVLDDLHWADVGSVQLLRHVLAAGQSGRLLVVGTFRDSEIGQGHPLADALAALRREIGVERLVLRGLGDDELLSLLESTAGHEMTEDGIALRDALSRETAGNPFFIGELLRHLVEAGTIYRNEQGRWVSDTDVSEAGLPISIREVVGARVSCLGTDTVRVLSMAAVIGRDFDLGVLERVVDLDTDTIIDICDDAVAVAVLRETESAERYTFAHALIEHALYADLSAARRVRAHRAVAEALEDLCGNEPGERVSELAYHWGQATGPQDSAKAVEYARQAGASAITKLAPDEATRWYTDALALLDEAKRVERVGLEIRIGLGEAQKLSGDPGYFDALVRIAEEAFNRGQADLGVRAALAANRGAFSTARSPEENYLSVLRAALEVVHSDDDAERARLLAALAAELTFHGGADLDERVRIVDEAIGIARRLGEDALFVDVVTLSHLTRAVPENSELRWSDETEAITAANRTANPVLMLRAHWARAFTAAERGDRDAFDEHIEVLGPLAERVDVPLYRFFALHHEANVPWFDGEPEVMSAAAREIIRLGFESGNRDAAVVASPTVFCSAFISGTLAALIPGIEEFRDRYPIHAVFGAALAWAHARDGDSEVANSLLHEALGEGFAARRDLQWLGNQALWAEVAYHLGHVESAELLTPRLEPWIDLLPRLATTYMPATTHYAGLARSTIGDLDLAVEHLRRAIDIHQRFRAPFFIACSEVALAQIFSKRGTDEDLEQARTLAAANVALAKQRRYPYAERDARAVLEQLA
jgi:class 3 adenylate cyclase